MDVLPSLILSGSGVALAAMAFSQRTDPAWQRSMTWIMGLAVAQVGLGVLSLIVGRLSR